jgi:hypothetical protein
MEARARASEEGASGHAHARKVFVVEKTKNRDSVVPGVCNRFSQFVDPLIFAEIPLACCLYFRKRNILNTTYINIIL